MVPIKAEEEFSKNTKLKKENIEYLRDWLSRQPHLPSGITDEQLILFLHCCQHHLEDCKQVIETYYTIRTHSPELFADRDPKGAGVQQSLSVMQFTIMPNRDQHGNVVMIARVADLNPDKFHYNDAVKTWFMMQDVFLLENGTTPGFVILVDSKGFGLGHFAKISIQTIKKYCMYTQEALPGNVIGTHFLNSNAVTDAVITMFKPFSSSDTFQKLYSHSTMNTLYKYVSKDALPKEFGGYLDSMATYHKATVELLERYRDWFKEEEAFRVDESKRLGNPKNAGDIFGMEGSFKKLDFD